MKEELESRVQESVELFMQGYSCSQSVVMAFSDLYGIDRKTAGRMALGFGGGVGRLRMMCGAVSGMVMLAGLDKDRECSPLAKTECYKLVQTLISAYKERNGSVTCAELLKGCRIDSSPVASERNAEYYKIRPCAKKVESAARIFAEYLDNTETL